MAQDDVVTPPEDALQLLPTPPNTNEKLAIETPALSVLRIWKEIRAGSWQSVLVPWHTILLDEAQYARFARLLEADQDLSEFVEDKLRIDYDASRSELIIRMPTKQHEVFIAQVRQHISLRLLLLATQSDAIGEWATKTLCTDSTDIPLELKYNDKASKRSPDSSWCHEAAQYPGLVLEVSYSQKGKDLFRLADDYILGSNGNIQLVVGIDIEYKGTKSAKMYLWRPKCTQIPGTEEQELSAELQQETIFRDVDGTVLHDAASLSLRMSDFAVDSVLLEPVPSDALITVTPAHLCDWLELPNKMKLNTDSGVRNNLPAGTRKRRRSSSSVEELAQEDEARYHEAEERVEKTIAGLDADFMEGTRAPKRRMHSGRH